MAFDDVRKIVNSYSKNRKRFGDVSIYKLVIKLTGSTSIADEFMLSDLGGYEFVDLYKIKQKINYDLKRIRN